MFVCLDGQIVLHVPSSRNAIQTAGKRYLKLVMPNANMLPKVTSAMGDSLKRSSG